MWCNRAWLWVQESLLEEEEEEEHFLKHLLFLGRRASFNPRISVSEIIRWTERNGEKEKEKVCAARREGEGNWNSTCCFATRGWKSPWWVARDEKKMARETGSQSREIFRGRSWILLTLYYLFCGKRLLVSFSSRFPWLSIVFCLPRVGQNLKLTRVDQVV